MGGIMKKLLACLTILIMTVSLLTGCGPDELTFMQINQEMSTMDTYTMNGTINWNTDLESLFANSADLMPAELDSQKEFIRIIEKEGLKHIAFTYAVDLKNEAMEAHYTAGSTPLFSLLLKGDTYYVNFDGLFDLVKRNDTQAIQDTELYGNLESLRGKYLTVTAQDLVDGGLTPSELMPRNSLVTQQAFRKNVLTYFMDFVKTELSGHNPGLVKKSYDTNLQTDVYGYSINIDQIPMITLDLMMYLLDHLDGTEALVTKIVADPFFKEQAGLDGDTVSAEVETAFDELRNDLDATREQLSVVLAEEKASHPLSTQIQTAVGSSSIESSIAKLGPKKFWNQVKIKIDNPSSEFPLKSASLETTVILDASRAPVIVTPIASIPFNAFNDELTHSLILEPDTDTATYDAGLLNTRHLDVDMININGHWFISLGTLPKHFQNLVKHDGSIISLGDKALIAHEVHLSGDTTYLALSAFRNAGVGITWNDNYRTLTVEY